MTIKWRHCEIAERDHREDIRNYAHTFHYPRTICVCKAFWELPKVHRDGILLHEIGHLLAGPEAGEEGANQAGEEWSGAKIQYVDSPYGRHLERLGNMARSKTTRRRSNPVHHSDQLPYDEWVPSHAVKFNSDGTVDIMTEAQHNLGRRRNVTTEEVHAGVKILIAVTQAIHDAGEIPSGHLYAMLSGRMDLNTYESMIRTLIGTGLVEKRGDLLSWVGPE